MLYNVIKKKVKVASIVFGYLLKKFNDYTHAQNKKIFGKKKINKNRKKVHKTKILHLIVKKKLKW